MAQPNESTEPTLKVQGPRPALRDQGVPLYDQTHHPLLSGSVTPEPWSIDLRTVVPLGALKLGACFMVVIL